MGVVINPQATLHIIPCQLTMLKRNVHDTRQGRREGSVFFNHAVNCYNDTASATIKEIQVWSIGGTIPTGKTPQYLE